MDRKKIKIVRKQLGNTLEKFAALCDIQVPPKGWLRAVREALGMNGRQFASRMGVSPARVSRIESDEVTGVLTLNTLRKAADALDCKLVYSLVPKTSLNDTVKKQAVRRAKKQLEITSHTMALEAQELSPKWQKDILDEMIEKMLRDQPKNFWD